MKCLKVNRGTSPKTISNLHHVKTATLNIIKGNAQNSLKEEKQLGQKRLHTNMIPPTQMKKAQSPSSKIFYKKNSTITIDKNYPSTQKNFLKTITSGKENIIRKKAHSPQIHSKKAGLID